MENYLTVRQVSTAVILVFLAIMLLPLTASAATYQYVIITVTPGNVSEVCPANFTIVEASDYEFLLSWDNATGANVTGITVRGAYARDVANATDGFDVYTGNGTSVTHWINTEFLGVDVYYRAYATLGNGTYSPC